MRQFLKLITSSCLGTILAFLTLFLVLAIMSIPSSPDKGISSKSILHIKLNGTVPELTNNVESSPYVFEQTNTIGLNDIKKLLKTAESDNNIEGLLIQTESTSMNPTKALEISRTIAAFKESDKFCYAYGDYFTQSGYLVAAVADSIFLNPNGFIDMRGLGMEIPYFKEFADKSKISFDVYFAGKYKSAIEPYYLDEISDNNRIQSQAFLDDYLEYMSDHIGYHRSLEAQDILDAMNRYETDNAKNSKQLGFIDQIAYAYQVEDRLKILTDSKKLNLISLEDYYINSSYSSQSGTDRIAIVYAEGTINQFGDAKGSITVNQFDKTFDKLEKNKKVKAIVVRVNSPGGSAFASDVIWEKIENLKSAGKVVVASFGDYAASGGYYIACGADYIVSEPTCLTGSIGVYSMMPNFGEFFKDNLGINWDTIGTGQHNFIYSIFTPKSDSDNQKLQRNTERTYQKFLSRVSNGRGIDIDSVNQIAQGRVWSGKDALSVGLVDTIASLEESIMIAADLADIDSYKVLQYPVIERSIYEEIISTIMSESAFKAMLAPDAQRRLIDKINNYLEPIIEATETPQARLPFVLTE